MKGLTLAHRDLVVTKTFRGLRVVRYDGGSSDSSAPNSKAQPARFETLEAARDRHRLILLSAREPKAPLATPKPARKPSVAGLMMRIKCVETCAERVDLWVHVDIVAKRVLLRPKRVDLSSEIARYSRYWLGTKLGLPKGPGRSGLRIRRTAVGHRPPERGPEEDKRYVNAARITSRGGWGMSPDLCGQVLALGIIVGARSTVKRPINREVFWRQMQKCIWPATSAAHQLCSAANAPLRAGSVKPAVQASPGNGRTGRDG